MMFSMKRWTLLALAAGILAVGCNGGSSTPEGETPNTTNPATTAQDSTEAAAATGTTVAYAQVQEILTKNCVGCHGEKKPQDGVNLTNYEAVMKGGEHGAIVKPGNPTESELIEVMRGAEGHKLMPPAGALPDDQIKIIEDWIAAGAKA
jgi:mono/diheme cytochrome c family protein